MIAEFDPTTFVKMALNFPVIDVRSPGEFAQGHISGALNIPLYTDEERAVVGALYVKSGKDQAILKGLDIALPQIDRYLSALSELASAEKLLIHCWRGGLRSATMAEVFRNAGYDVGILKGGYKAYRRYIREELTKPRMVIVLGGYTGSGKTDLLQTMAAMGEQVIDLEALARHKGSVFGALGQLPQPTNEQFENDLFAKWSSTDPLQPIWLEDESRMIGNITLPEPVFEKLNAGFMVRINVEKSIRIEHLVEDYSKFDKILLSRAIQKISQRIGGTCAKAASEALDNNDFHTVADIVLSYYDKAYQFAIEHRKGKTISEISVTGDNFNADVLKIIKVVEGRG
ncbi:MAG: tRNA 2-selenouridine(34) synthase MnmH [Bacteroidota bacterium]